MQNYNADDHIVDQMIGSAYQVVKYVASNMEMMIALSKSIQTLQGYLSKIDDVLANKEAIVNIHAHMAELLTITQNMNALLNINSNIPALMNIANNLAAILAVPGSIAAMDFKPSVRVATTENIVLSGITSIDGVTLFNGDRVLVKSQTNKAENGIYIVGVNSWTRAADSNGINVSTNNLTLVDSGALNGGKMYRLATVGGIVVGTTAQDWVELTTGLKSLGDGVSVLGSQPGSVKSLKGGNNVSVTDAGDGNIVIESAGGGGSNVAEVLDAILTDANGILHDSEGHVLYELKE